MEFNKYLLLSIIVLLNACSESEIEANRISSSNSTKSESLTAEEGQELLDELQNKTAVSMFKGNAVILPNTPTVLEQHNRWYGTEAQKAKGKTLEHYLAWVQCYQGLQYVGHGLYHPITIGQLISRLGAVDPELPSAIHNCARQQPPIEKEQRQRRDNENSPELVEVEKNEKSLQLEGAPQLLFKVLPAKKATRRVHLGIVEKIAFTSTDEQFSGQLCYDLEESLAHYAASLKQNYCLTMDKRVVDQEGLDGWPYLISKNERPSLGVKFENLINWYDISKIENRNQKPEGQTTLRLQSWDR